MKGVGLSGSASGERRLHGLGVEPDLSRFRESGFRDKRPRTESLVVAQAWNQT